MNKYSMIASALLLSACSGYSDSFELESTEQELSTAQFAGWRNEDGWEHRRCNISNSSNICMYPKPRSGANKWLRRVSGHLDIPANPPTNVNYPFAGAAAQLLVTSSTNNWEFESQSSTVGADLVIVDDESLYNGTPPNAPLLFSSVVHIGCTVYGAILTESYVGTGQYCDQVTATIDVGSFNSWLALWATDAQKNVRWSQLLGHIYAVSAGIGATDAAGSVMSRTIPKSGTIFNLTAFESCLSNSVNFNDPAYVDPNLGVYTNSCNP